MATYKILVGTRREVEAEMNKLGPDWCFLQAGILTADVVDRFYVVMTMVEQQPNWILQRETSDA